MVWFGCFNVQRRRLQPGDIIVAANGEHFVNKDGGSDEIVAALAKMVFGASVLASSHCCLLFELYMVQMPSFATVCTDPMPCMPRTPKNWDPIHREVQADCLELVLPPPS